MLFLALLYVRLIVVWCLLLFMCCCVLCMIICVYAHVIGAVECVVVIICAQCCEIQYWGCCSYGDDCQCCGYALLLCLLIVMLIL